MGAAARQVYLPEWLSWTESIISTEVELSSPTKDLALPLTSATPSLSHVILGTGVPSATHVKTTFSPGEAVILLG